MDSKIYIVGTPIGNLEDITLRALHILGEVDLIACEDTRHTRKLLSHYDISTPLTSYHEHNKKEKAPQLLRTIQNGRTMAIVSDAGMPGISDPGYVIIQEAISLGVPIEVVPGPTSIESALVLSGLPTDRFAFEGFLPPKEVGRKKRLLELLYEDRTMVFFEAAHRIVESLSDIKTVFGDRSVVLVKELTKLYETVYRGSAQEIREELGTETPRGEFILLVSGKADETNELSSDELLEVIQSMMSVSRMEALKLAAHILGVSKSKLYKEKLENN